LDPSPESWRSPKLLSGNEIPNPRTNNQFLDVLASSDIEHTQNPEIRLRHAHGQTQKEMWEIKFGDRDARNWRLPDLIAFPKSNDEVIKIVQWANRFDVMIVPFGGGTSVSEALLLPHEERFIVVVSTRRLSKIVTLDTENMFAEIQAGCLGRDIERVLKTYGVTLGHEPDSIEFSTMGGWVATHASGMKKNRYGNIEDIVLDIKVVTSNGLVQRLSNIPFPRESVCLDLKRLFFGSEGNFGIILSATCRLRPLPEIKLYGSIIFKSYSEGIKFLREAERSENVPSSMRLFDNLQFRLSQVLKPEKAFFGTIKSAIEKFVVLNILGFDAYEMTACTYICEGPKHLARSQEKRLNIIAASFGGILGGSSNGETGYHLTFAIAYLRDWLNEHHIVAESFECSVPWAKVESMLSGLKTDFQNEWEKLGFGDSKYFLSSRVTQIYSTGVCCYFYMGICDKTLKEDTDPMKVYEHMEHVARKSILRHGGNLSHHHGVGKIRKSFISQIANENAIQTMNDIKRALDPKNIFGIRNNFIH